MVGGHLAPETRAPPHPPVYGAASEEQTGAFSPVPSRSRLCLCCLLPLAGPQVLLPRGQSTAVARHRAATSSPRPSCVPPSLDRPPTGVLSALNSFRCRPRPRLRLAVTWGPGWMSAGGSAPEAEERGLWVSAPWPWPPGLPRPSPRPFPPPPPRSWLLLRGSGCRLLRARARVGLPPRLSLPPVCCPAPVAWPPFSALGGLVG